MYFCTLYSKYIYFTLITIIYRNRYSLQPSNQVRACDAACQGEAALGWAGRQVEGGGAGVSLHGDTTNIS